MTAAQLPAMNHVADRVRIAHRKMGDVSSRLIPPSNGG
jgi:subtilisin-like proprotein convertase family protein